MSLRLSLKFKNYIAHPFWPEQKQLIEIQKKSGMNMARGETKRAAALRAELEKRGLSEADYESIQKAAAKPFHVSEAGWIYIPSRNVESFLAHVAQVCPRAMRGGLTAQNAHSSTVVVTPGLITQKRQPDGEFTRFVKLEMSNERSLQSNSYIEDFEAVGRLELADGLRKEDIFRLMEWGGREIGMGASRSQGYGRFSVEQLG